MAVEKGLTSARERQAADGVVALLVKPKGGPIPKWTGGRPKPESTVKASSRSQTIQLELPLATAGP